MENEIIIYLHSMSVCGGNIFSNWITLKNYQKAVLMALK